MHGCLWFSSLRNICAEMMMMTVHDRQCDAPHENHSNCDFCIEQKFCSHIAQSIACQFRMALCPPTPIVAIAVIITHIYTSTWQSIRLNSGQFTQNAFQFCAINLIRNEQQETIQKQQEKNVFDFQLNAILEHELKTRTFHLRELQWMNCVAIKCNKNKVAWEMSLFTSQSVSQPCHKIRWPNAMHCWLADACVGWH